MVNLAVSPDVVSGLIHTTEEAMTAINNKVRCATAVRKGVEREVWEKEQLKSSACFVKAPTKDEFDRRCIELAAADFRYI